MKTKQEILDAAEERCMNWSWDSKIPVLISALSTYPNLPREMKEQEAILSAIHLKADIYGRYREALFGLTSNEARLRVESAVQGLNLTGMQIPRNELATKCFETIEKIAAEMNRIEKEVMGTKLDIGAILRFLRTP